MSYAIRAPSDLVLAAALLLINGVMSIVFRLGLERTLLIASVRMVVQLALIGLVLRFVFAQELPWWTAALALGMIAAAGYEIMARQERPLAGWMAYGLGTGALLISGVATTVFAVAAVISPVPWYAPRYVLPVLGMVLGNSMTGVALALNAVTDWGYREQAAIEAQLALGATRFEAFGSVLKRALKTGMMPIINAFAASGIVSLPGMMTGQILAGVDPVEATKYQVMIMFVIASATALAVVMGAFGAVYLLTDERHRLRLDRLAAKK